MTDESRTPDVPNRGMFAEKVFGSGAFNPEAWAATLPATERAYLQRLIDERDAEKAQADSAEKIARKCKKQYHERRDLCLKQAERIAELEQRLERVVEWANRAESKGCLTIQLDIARDLARGEEEPKGKP